MLKGKTNRVCRIAGRLSSNAGGGDKLLSLILTIKLMILILLIRYW
jgi:hypothetical protein